MKTSYLFLALSLGLAVGCGGAPAGGGTSNNGNTSSNGSNGNTSSSGASGDVAVDSAALTDTATESADLTTSMGSDDVGLSAGGMVGASDDMDDHHAEIVGAVLRAAINPKACTSGSASITIAPMKTSTCADIGFGGKYPGGATIAFNQCVLRDGAVIDGSVVFDETRDLAAGQTCSPTAVVDVTRALTIAKLSFTSPTKAVLEYDNVSASVVSEHALGARPTSVESKQSGERKVTDAAGKLTVDTKFSSDVTVVSTAKTATAPASRTINGMSSVTEAVGGAAAMVSLKDVELVRTCCKPIAGTITIEKTPAGGTAVSHTVTFGPMCGDVTVDGKAVTVPECI